MLLFWAQQVVRQGGNLTKAYDDEHCYLVEKNIYYARKGDFFFFKVPETLFKNGVVWQPTPLFLPGESQGQGSLVGCRLWGCTESDTTEATLQQQ